MKTKKKREMDAKSIQKELDRQHAKRDYVNSLYNKNLTTKEALRIYESL